MSHWSVTTAPSPYESGIWGTPENPCPSERTLAARLDGELDVARSKAVEQHLDSCAACASDYQRLENLSGCLKAWQHGQRSLAAPTRLSARVLGRVSAEGSAIRLESAVAHRRVAFAAAAAVLVVSAAAWWGAAGWWGGRDARRSAEPREATAAPGISLPAFDVPFSRRSAEGPRSAEGSRSAEGPRSAEGALDRVPRPVAPRAAPIPPARVLDLSLLRDAATRDVFAALVAEGAAPEVVAVLDGTRVPRFAAPAYGRLRRWGRWIEERERLAREPDTRDRDDAGLALADVLPDRAFPDSGLPDSGLPDSGLPGSGLPGSGFPDSGVPVSGLPGRATPRVDDRATAATEAATSSRGGLSLQRLPSVPSSALLPSPYDLAGAVREGVARFLPDARVDAGDVTLEVTSKDRALFVPAGELIAGGAGDRVVASGTWLAPSPASYVVRIATRPVARVLARPVSTPRAVGMIAGPQLRAWLARGEDATAILELAHAQVREAGLLGPDGAADPSLLALYDAEGADAERRALRLAGELGPRAAGFVAADPDGRFQGLERFELADDVRVAWIARFVAGYLVEGRTRSVADAPRAGVRARDVLSSLERRPPRLVADAAATPSASIADARPVAPVRAIEPVAGIVLHGARSSPTRVPWLSALVPDYAH